MLSPRWNINSPWWQWLFSSARIAPRQTQRKALLFPMGQGSIYSPPLRRGREPRGFSGTAVWQTADVLYTRASLFLFSPLPPFLFPFTALHPPFHPFFYLLHVLSFVRQLSLFVRVHEMVLGVGVFTIRQALSNAQMTLIDMSTPVLLFLFLFLFLLLLLDTGIPPDM